MTIAPLREDEEEDTTPSLQDPSVNFGPEDRLTIPFQNENLYAYVVSPGKAREVGPDFPPASQNLMYMLFRSWLRFQT